MASKKRKKSSSKKKKAAPRIARPEVPEPIPPILPAAGRPCICIENDDGWFCMKRLPNGELKECNGPFDTKEQ
jgi:hypothetical protein